MKCNVDIVWKFGQLLLGSVGLYLGYLYYRLQNTFFLKNEEKQRKRVRLDHIMDELNKIDSHVRIFFKPEKFSDADLLNDAKEGLERGFLSISIYLEQNEKLLGFSGDELKKLVSVASFIENEKVASCKYDEDRKILEGKKYRYIQVIQEARSVCVQKMEYV